MSVNRLTRCSNSGNGVTKAWESSLVEVRMALHLNYRIVEELNFVKVGRILALERMELLATE